MSLFREHRSWAPEPIVSPFPGVNLFGGNRAPSLDQAMRDSAVWACVWLVAETVSMMPLDAFTKRAGVRVPISNPPLLERPSSDALMPDWISMIVVSLMLRGNSYGHILNFDRDGYPDQIEIMDPDVLRAHQDRATGKMIYQTPANGVIPNDRIWHTRAYRLPGRPFGLSPIQYASTKINTNAAIDQFALGYFQDAPHPSSVLTSDQSINQEQARTIKERLIASVSGREPLVLGAGLKFSGLSVTPEESQFLATQKLGVAGIARIFRVPPEMIAAEAGNSMTYANIESKGVDFLTYSIQSWLNRIEAAIAPLMAGKKHARFDTSVLTRTDLETRIKAGAIAIASKQQTPDEVRAWSDLPPLTDEQKTFLELVPLTVSPTGMPKSTLPKGVPSVNENVPEGEPA
jgi:HK97 family phage portal protein